MASTKQAERHSTERGADATGQGRKVLCAADLGNGAKCELWKDHAGEHDSLEITGSDLDMEFMADDEVASLVRTVAVRSAEQIAVDKALDRNYQEWLKRGADSDKPVWSKFTVASAKARKMRNFLRNAADQHEPPIQVRISESFQPGGVVVIAFAAGKRRAYNRQAKSE